MEEQEGIFGNVVGMEGAKKVVRGALRSGDVHVLMEGPPGSGKSIMLMAIEENIPGVVYRDANRVHAPKLQEKLAENPPILLIDEMDALSSNAYDVLSLPMEHGRITEETERAEYDIEIDTQIIGACNNSGAIPENIQSRMRTIEFEAYDLSENVRVAGKILPNQVHWMETEEEAREAAEIVYEITGTHDPRDIRDIAVMSTDMDDLEEMAVSLNDPSAEVDSEPLRPEDVERAKGEVGKKRLKQLVMAQSDGGESGDTDMSEDIDGEIDEYVKKEIVKEMSGGDTPDEPEESETEEG